MSEQGEKLLKASMLGVAKIDTERFMSDGSVARGTISEYDDSQTLGIPGVHSAANLAVDIAEGRAKFHPRQIFGQRKTCIYNPKREDIEVEAEMGVNEYNPKVEKDSKEELLKKNTALSNDMEVMKGQMTTLIATVGQAKPETVVVEVNKKMETVTGHSCDGENSRRISPVDSNTPMTELRVMAKNRGINLFQKSKATLIEEINGGNTA